MWKGQLESIEQRLTQLVSLHWLILATLALLVVEYLSDNQILRGIGGMSDLRRALISAGMAVAYRHYSAKYVPQEEQAKAAKLGMWGSTFVEPWTYRANKRAR